MLVLDNSVYSINGDYPRKLDPSNLDTITLAGPADAAALALHTATRLAAQADAVHLLFNTKLNHTM